MRSSGVEGRPAFPLGLKEYMPSTWSAAEVVCPFGAIGALLFHGRGICGRDCHWVLTRSYELGESESHVLKDPISKRAVTRRIRRCGLRAS